MTFPLIILAIPLIFLIYEGGKESHLWKAGDVMFYPLLEDRCGLLASYGKGGRTRNRLVAFLPKDTFFELKPLAPLFFLYSAINDLFFGVVLVNELDLKVFLIDLSCVP